MFMKNSRLITFFLILLTISPLTFTSFTHIPPKPIYKDPKRAIEERVHDLIGRMTLEEKVGQLSTLLGWEMYIKKGNAIMVSPKFKEAVKSQHIGMLWATLRADPWTKKTLKTGLSSQEAAIATNALQRYMLDSTRLGIPLLLAEECPHGHMAVGATVFPTAIGQASTWNPALIQEMAQAIALETRATGGHIGYGPILDLAREPRWSRLEETYGEDPVLIAKMGTAMVTGFQGNNLKSGQNIISTLKHFTAYGVPEGGHNGGSVTLGERELRQCYLLPFQQAVKAGALSIMTAYNSIDGIPCTANSWLLKGILREQWRFNGFTISDLGSISGLVGSHHVAASATEAAAQAIHAGLDADLSGYGYGPALLKALKEGLVHETILDTAVRRVLYQKFAMGLFENPYVNVHQASEVVRSRAHINLARRVAQQSIILLKNDKNLLPLKKSIKRIAVIGPNAHNIYNQLGDYTAPQSEENIVTVLEGIQAKLGPHAQIDYVKGCAIRDTTEVTIPAAVQAAKKAEVVVVVLGGSSARDFKTSYQETGAAEVSISEGKISDMESGEGFDRATLNLLGKQLELLKALQATGKPVVLVTIKGRPLNLNWAAKYINAIVDAWYPGQEGGNAIADVLFGDYNPAGRLPVSVPKSIGQLPVYYNYKAPNKHNYVEMDAKPLFPFGYGLSYTTFAYTDLKSELRETADDDLSLRISFNLKNEGQLDGDEVVQLYVKDEISSVVTPILQLKDFQRIHLKAGEEKTVDFTLHADDLKLLNTQMEWMVEKGVFKLMIGSSSDQIQLTTAVMITRNYFL